MCISTVNNTKQTNIKLPSCVAELKDTCAMASKSVRKHLIVQHNYHDRANEPVLTGVVSANQALEDSNMNHNAFPLKLYEMLSLVDRDGFADVVSWQPHGRCFVVHKAEEFKAILPRYFKLSKVASFQRQLNLYGFMRLTRGLDKGGYYHEFFLQGKPQLAQRIQRVKVKGTGVRAKSNPEQEPDFWSMPWTTCANENKEADIEPNQVFPPTTSSSSAIPTAHAARHVEDCCTTSIVSQDHEETPMHALHQHFILEDVTSMPLEPHEDTVVTSWGMPFHYLPRPEDAHVATIDDDMDKILGDMNFDEVMQDILDNTEGYSFADLLERAAQ